MNRHHEQVLQALYRAIQTEKPRDILQFCANYFNRALEEERNRRDMIWETSSAVCSPRCKSPQERLPSHAEELHSKLSESVPVSAFTGSTEETSESLSNSGDSKGPKKEPKIGWAPHLFQTSHGPSYRSGKGACNPMDENRHEDSDAAQDIPKPPAHVFKRRTSISAESLMPSDSAVPPLSVAMTPSTVAAISDKNDEKIQLIESSIKNNLLFRKLEKEQIIGIYSAITTRNVKNDEIIMRQGDSGDYFYIVQDGEFKIYQKHDNEERLVSVMGRGDSFGELALMYNAPRAATIICSSETGILLCLDRVTFQRIIMCTIFRRQKMLETFLSHVPILATLDASQRRKIADALGIASFSEGTEIVREGDIGDVFYIIVSGEAEVIKKDVGVVSHLHAGDHFGELALIHNTNRTATVQATTDVKAAVLSNVAFKKLFGNLFMSTKFGYPNEESSSPSNAQQSGEQLIRSLNSSKTKSQREGRVEQF